jgi:myo-inositol-1(or 4)-monophosphatase
VVDRKVEDFIVRMIKENFPGHDIIGEETGKTDRGDESCWIIDPIDGTTSYFHGQPYYSVSIAYMRNGTVEAGVVYAPALGQLFSAEKGEGAWLNGSTKLEVTQTDSMINSVLATGFACLRAGRQPNNLSLLSVVLPKIRDIRRCGSAAIDLAYVAAGKLDGFWEMDLNIYDVAAGVLLVEEAGGEVFDMEGKGNYPSAGIAATNGKITQALLACF